MTAFSVAGDVVLAVLPGALRRRLGARGRSRSSAHGSTGAAERREPASLPSGVSSSRVSARNHIKTLLEDKYIGRQKN